MLLSVGILVSYVGDADPQSSGADSATLSYPQYLSLCPRHSGSGSGRFADLKAPADTRCLITEGLLISWEGSVISTKLSNVYNPISSIITRMPQVVNNIFFPTINYVVVLIVFYLYYYAIYTCKRYIVYRVF